MRKWNERCCGRSGWSLTLAQIAVGACLGLLVFHWIGWLGFLAIPLLYMTFMKRR